MYHQQQNKWYPQSFSLPHFEAIYITFQPSYYGQVNSLRLKTSVAWKWASKDLLGVPFILLLMVQDTLIEQCSMALLAHMHCTYALNICTYVQ